MKFGFVAIVGKPNAGKSTLINQILKSKISIVTHRKNTTQKQIEAIYTDKEAQIVFWDTPGILKSNSLLEEKMKNEINYSVSDADIVLFLIPFWKDFDQEFARKINLNKIDAKKIAVITQIDLAKDKTDIFNSIKKIDELKIFSDIVPISAKKNKNINTLIKVIKSYLSESPEMYYDTAETPNVWFNDSFYVTEIIREKILMNFHNEIPYRVYIKVVKKEQKENLFFYKCDILVDDKKIKKIIIGYKGLKIKTIGQQARIELEKKFNTKVFLELNVKTSPNWQNQENIIKNI